MNIVAGADDRFATAMAVDPALANTTVGGRYPSISLMAASVSCNCLQIGGGAERLHVDVHLEWVIPDLLHLTGMKTR